MEELEQYPIEIYLSTDGKHTVRVSTKVRNADAALAEALNLYEQIAERLPNKLSNGKVTPIQTQQEKTDDKFCDEHKTWVEKKISNKTNRPYWGCKASGEMHFIK